MMERRYLIFFVMLFSLSSYAGTNYVLCVGLSDYPGTRNDLHVSANDAKVISDLFRKNGNSSIRLVQNSNASRANVMKLMHSMFDKAGKNDAVIFFFSGHGMKNGLVCYDGVLAFSSVVNIMKKSKAKNKIIFADACFSGKMRTTSKHQSQFSKENVMFFLSSRSEEISRESLFRNSIFTIFLSRGLQGEADSNGDRRVTAIELYEYVRKGVLRGTEGKQHPVMWGKFDDNMTIIKW